MMEPTKMNDEAFANDYVVNRASVRLRAIANCKRRPHGMGCPCSCEGRLDTCEDAMIQAAFQLGREHERERFVRAPDPSQIRRANSSGPFDLPEGVDQAPAMAAGICGTDHGEGFKEAPKPPSRSAGLFIAAAGNDFLVIGRAGRGLRIGVIRFNTEGTNRIYVGAEIEADQAHEIAAFINAHAGVVK